MPKNLAIVGYGKMGRLIEQLAPDAGFCVSLKLDIEQFARAVRSHLGVENKLHWVMDVCVGEDQSRARSGYAAENLAALRRLTLNLLKKEKAKRRGIRGKMLNASWDHPYLLRLLGVEPKEI